MRRLRGELAGRPEPSGAEGATAELVAHWLRARGLRVEEGVGGHGLLVRTTAEGSGMLWRAELDAVVADGSVGHHCGHDGHMAMLCGALERMQRHGRPVTALFQPAEETGEGMQPCLEDPRLAGLEATHAFALHNTPGVASGSIVLGPGAMASTGLRLRFSGRSSHAAEPWEGTSPWPQARAAADAVFETMEGDPRATLVHVRLGRESYGTSPGTAVVAATVRGSDDAAVRSLLERLVPANGDAQVRMELVEPFPATHNDPGALALARAAAGKAGLQVVERQDPWPWSEDFGHALSRWPGALVGIGSGTGQAALHDSGYVFPDDLLEAGISFWCALGGCP